MELQQGANTSVGGGALRVSVELTAPSGCDVDVSAYLLADNGRVRGDHDMVFYNQPTGADGAVKLADRSAAGASFEVDTGRLPAAISKLVFCVTIEEAQARRQTLAMVSNARIVVRSGGAVVASFAPALSGATEAAMTFGELYKRNNEWKFRAVGQGFNGGLGPLARSFGIDVAD